MKAVVLAGGLGVRLRPLTAIIPKPMLPLGEKALLEIQIGLLREHGFDEIFLALNYKADYVRSYFGDGSRYGVVLNYSVESEPLGTCGPLSLIKERLTEPFILMNGDILTEADLSKIYAFAAGLPDSRLTIATKVLTTPFRFGNIESDGIYVTGVEEKPDFNFEVLAGIYVLKPAVFELIPDNTYYGIDRLIQEMLQNGMPVTKYVLREYWLDIGVVEDYEQAQRAYQERFIE